jgi:hypothetical protein
VKDSHLGPMRDQTTASHNAFAGSIQNGSLNQENRARGDAALRSDVKFIPRCLQTNRCRRFSSARSLYIRRGELLQ